MKIAVNTRFLLTDKLEGIGKFTHEILKRITVNHPEHQFYFFFDRAFDKRFIYSANITPVVLGPPARHSFLFYIWFQLSVKRALKKIKPDVFLSTDGLTTLATGVPRVTVIHDLAFEHYPHDLDYISRSYYQYFTPKFAIESNKIIAVSEFTKQDIAAQYGIDFTKINVVYNDAGSQFKPINFEKQVKIRQKYTAGEAYFIFVGALQPRKNLVNLFLAFDIFKQKTGSEVKLVIVGRKAWQAGSISKGYNQMQFKSEVVFTGRVSDEELVELYGGAVATVYVPTFEGFGIPIVEAQKCGSPVITSNTSSMPEVAGQGAILVNPFAEEEIADALLKVYHELETRQKLVQLGEQNAGRFSWEASAEKVMRVLEEAVKKK